jgi:hypothetical protein
MKIKFFHFSLINRNLIYFSHNNLEIDECLNGNLKHKKG